jgi:hypothetical protein
MESDSTDAFCLAQTVQLTEEAAMPGVGHNSAHSSSDAGILGRQHHPHASARHWLAAASRPAEEMPTCFVVPAPPGFDRRQGDTK